MRTSGNRRDAALMDEIYSDPARAAKAMTYRVYVDGEPVRVTSARAFSAADAPAVGLDCSLPWPLDPTSERKEAKVELFIEGIRWTDYTGTVVKLTEDESGSFGASTAGYYQGGEDSVKFGEEKSYSAEPSAALLDMLRRLPYRRVMVPHIPLPLFVREGPDVYPLMAPVGEGIDAVEGVAGVVQKDTFLDEARVFPAPSIGGITSSEEPVRWTVGREITEFSADLKNNARFRDVGMVRQLPTGKYEELVTPRPEVRYAPGIEPPPINTTFYEELPEDSATLDARSRAASVAGALSFGGEHQVSFTTPFIDPRIEDYDMRDILRHNYATNVSTLYRVLIESQDRDYALSQASYSGTGVILERKKVSPIPSVTRRSIENSTPFPSESLMPSESLFPVG